MRVLIAPDCFTGTLTAPQAAEAMARGWLRTAPADVLELCPLADGGPGFVPTLHAVLASELLPVVVTGPLGEPAPATILLVEGEHGPTAYLESAQAAGLALVPPDRRDPTRTSSAGVGELILAAVAAGARRIVVGVGGTGTNDAGAGLLAALGAQGPGGAGAAAGRLRGGGGGLGDVTVDDLAGLAGVIEGLAGVDLVAAVDVDVPLLGLHGANAGFAAQKGATPEQAQELERALGHFAHLATLVAGERPVRPDLLARPFAEGRTPAFVSPGHEGHSHASSRDDGRLVSLPGAGAGGGIGFALALLGARLVPGSVVVADAVGLVDRLSRADLVVTGEGTFDWQSLRGKVVSTVASLALDAGIPTVVIAGQVEVGRREWSGAGISGAYAVAETPAQVDAALADPAATLEARAARIARTWSR